MRRRAHLLLPLLVLLPACETTNVAPHRDTGSVLEGDEQRLWTRAREEEEVLEHSGFLAPAPAAEDYCNRLLASLHPSPLPGGARLHARVLVDPTLNAFALPDGSIYIHTGMLARLQNEAQLAAVLGHELTHATHRHALRGYRNLKNQTGFLATFTIATGGAGGVVTLLGTLGTLSAVTGYSQDLERQADQEGFRLITDAGYDPRESPKVFQTLLAESRRSKLKEPFFFGSHPRLTERIQSFERLVSALPADRRQGRLGAEEYSAGMIPLFLVNAEAALRAGDPVFARDSARRYLEGRPDDPAGLLVIAESHRKHTDPGDAAEALRLYRELTTRHPGFADGYRGLGLMLFKQGDNTPAADAFRQYLALKPEAGDRSFVENLLQQCAPKT